MSRDPIQFPFSVDSIWNTPIGSNAVYVDANIEAARAAGADVDYFFVLDPNDPMRPLYGPGAWETGRSTGTLFQNIVLPLPDDLIVPDAVPGRTPNNAAAFLLPDGRTLVQVNALTRDQLGGAVYGWRSPNEDLYGTGITGGHAGSGLSSIGGTLRRGELTGNQPIQHALKINLQASRYLSFMQGANGGLGYRWPAVRADGYANSINYGGTNPNLMMGTLLAIPPNVTADSLGLTTPAGRKLFDALKNYGAYIADDTYGDAHAITVEQGVLEEFEQAYGYAFEGTSGAFYDDYMKLFSSLHIVANNGPTNIGGGGTPRVSPAPEFASEVGSIDFGGAGDDVIEGNDGKNTLYGENGNDFISGFRESDFLHGGGGGDSVLGGPGNDYVYGDNNNDFVAGGDDRDYVDGGFGDDYLDGGTGDDYLSGWSGSDFIDGGSGFDTLVESPHTTQERNLSYILTNDRLSRGQDVDELVNVEQVIITGDSGDTFIDALTFNAGNVIFSGGIGNDTLRGGSRGDTLLGGTGNDILNARGANNGRGTIDILNGGRGRDTFVLGNSDRTFYNDRDLTTGGWSDYAWIQDFNPARDFIQLRGEESWYFLGNSPIASTPGIAIYFDTNRNGRFNMNDELIAIVQGTTELSLSQNVIYT